MPASPAHRALLALLSTALQAAKRTCAAFPVAALLSLALAACATRPAEGPAPGANATPTATTPAAPTSPATPAASSSADPLGTAYHRAAEADAAARVPDPARGGPPVHEGASPLPAFLGVNRATARYVGTQTCAACHPAAAEVWARSAHAHALATLRDSQAGANPSCLPCHVTGFGHPGGWAGASTAQLADVGCEACHGPGSDHVAAPAPGYGDLAAGPASCVACHTHDNSPDFRFDGYWPRVAHGR